jgi:hypothetical protein
MNKILIILILLLPVFGQLKAQTKQEPKLIVYYFHITERCFTCTEIEKETVSLLKSAYDSELKSGLIVFQSVDVEQKENTALKTKYHMYGSGLLLVKPLSKGETNLELTNMAFQHVPGNIPKFRAELRTEINKLLKD